MLLWFFSEQIEKFSIISTVLRNYVICQKMYADFFLYNSLSSLFLCLSRLWLDHAIHWCVGCALYTCKFACLTSLLCMFHYPESKVHGANMGPNWGWQDPAGSHVGPMNFAIWVVMFTCNSNLVALLLIWNCCTCNYSLAVPAWMIFLVIYWPTVEL